MIHIDIFIYRNQCSDIIICYMFNSHINTQGLTKSLTEKIEALHNWNTNQSRDTFYHHNEIENRRNQKSTSYWVLLFSRGVRFLNGKYRGPEFFTDLPADNVADNMVDDMVVWDFAGNIVCGERHHPHVICMLSTMSSTTSSAGKSDKNSGNVIHDGTPLHKAYWLTC